MLALMWLLHWLPLPVLGRIGKLIGSVLFVLMRSRRHITLTNLKLCLPDLSDAARLQIARAHFQGYARSILERGILWWASPARLARLIVIEPSVPTAQIAQRPTILCASKSPVWPLRWRVRHAPFIRANVIKYLMKRYAKAGFGSRPTPAI